MLDDRRSRNVDRRLMQPFASWWIATAALALFVACTGGPASPASAPQSAAAPAESQRSRSSPSSPAAAPQPVVPAPSHDAPKASLPDDQVVPQDALVVSLVGRDACSAPKRHPHGVPTVRFEPDSASAYPWAIVRRVLLQQHEKFESCFRSSPALKACRNVTVNVRMTIASDGSVPRAATAAHDERLAACTESALLSLRFPVPPAGSIEARFPIRYRAVGE